MERHDTHALSYSSSSYNHSYEFDNLKKNKNNKRLISRNIKHGLNEGQLTNIQIKKINSILRKYNINSEQSQKSEGLFKHSQKTNNNKEEEININKNVLSTKNFSGDNTHTLSNKNKKRDNKKEKKKKRDKLKKDININDNNNNYVDEEKKEEIEEFKKEEPKIDISKGEDKKENFKYSISYRNYIRDTRFNNIQKNIDDENKKRNKKQENKNKLLIYKPVNIQGNLIREIKKPQISFITKVFKSLYDLNNNQNEKEEIPGLLLSIRNNYCFCTKQYTKNKEYAKKLKIIKYQKIKEEMNDEKIPTFSSINTSSSNSLYGTKSKSKNKKKQSKNKNKIKPKNIGKKKQTIFNKNMKFQRSISVYSKVSKEKSDEGKKSTSKKKTFKVPSIKKRPPYISEKKLQGVNKNIRKYSVVNRYRGKFSNIQKDIEKKIENENININVNINKEKEKDKEKEKENKDSDFKNFLEKQIIKKNKQIRNYIKKNRINSYNLFYPKEPSPLLGIFKSKYNIYSTLNMERKNSVDMGMNNNIIINNRQFYKITSHPRKGKTFYDDNSRKGFDNKSNKDNKDSNNKNNLHLIDKHYGLEKDCPLCRAFQMKKLKEDYYTINYIKAMKYKKMRINENNQRILSPNSFGFINGSEKEYSTLSRNRLSSAKKSEYIDDYSQIRRNFFVLFDYFNQ